jgi:hypothetical protein
MAMRSSRVTPFLLSTLLCGALVATSMGEGRLEMADDLESQGVPVPDQIEAEAPPRLSADLSDEIYEFNDCAEDYYYRNSYKYAAQQESSEDDVDVTDDRETEDYSYDSEEYVYDEHCQETDVQDHDSHDYGEWDSEYGYQDYDEYEYAAEDTQDVAPQTADDASDEEFSYDYNEFGSKYRDYYQDEYGYENEEDCMADDEEMEEEVASKISEYNYEEDYFYDYATDDNLLATDDENTEEKSEETADRSQDGSGDDDQYGYEYDQEYSYDYQDEYMTEEYAHGSDEAIQSDIQDDVEDVQEDGFAYEYDEEYSYGYEYEYMDEEYDYDTHEASRSDLEDDIEEVQEDSFSYEYYKYDSRYGYEYMEEEVEPAKTVELNAETEETELSYDYGNWEDEYKSESENESYDYTTEYDEFGEYTYQPETEDVQAGQTESDSQLEETGSWESEYDEYGDYMYESEIENVEVDETDKDSQFEEYGSWDSEYDESAEWESEYDYSGYVDDEMDADTPAEDDLGVYGGYFDAYSEPEAQDVAQEEPESSCDADEFGYDCYDAQVTPSEELAQDDYWTEYGYEYSYPETRYGSAGATEEESNLESCLEGEPGEPTYAMEECPEEDLSCGVELFAWHPNELLSYQDQEILKTLQRLREDPSGVRRATLNDYLEELGSDAIDFAGRFEDFSGVDVLGLADDLPTAAAFLGSFRLLERGELGVDEAVDMLRHGLDNLSLDWTEGVREITADALDDWDAGIDQSEDELADWLEVTSTARPIVVAMVSIANRSIRGAKGAITTVSTQLSDMELLTVLRKLSDD